MSAWPRRIALVIAAVASAYLGVALWDWLAWRAAGPEIEAWHSSGCIEFCGDPFPPWLAATRVLLFFALVWAPLLVVALYQALDLLRWLALAQMVVAAAMLLLMGLPAIGAEMSGSEAYSVFYPVHFVLAILGGVLGYGLMAASELLSPRDSI